MGDLVRWNGERGTTVFFQSELPYDVTQQQYGDKGYAGYRVADKVSAHGGWGIGVYAFFRDHNVTVASGIVAPKVRSHGARPRRTARHARGAVLFQSPTSLCVHESRRPRPQALESSFVAPFTVFLNGNGGIQHVINDKGDGSFGPKTSVNYVCS